VLDAERTLLEAQDRLAASQTRTVTAVVAVYKALGGRRAGDRRQTMSDTANNPTIVFIAFACVFGAAWLDRE